MIQPHIGEKKVTRKVAIMYLKAELSRLKALRKKPNLQGNRPYVAIDMVITDIEEEISRAKTGKKPMYEAQYYSWSD